MARAKYPGVDRRSKPPPLERYSRGGALAVIFGALVYITNLLLDPASRVLFGHIVRGICGATA
jgi:hypothetical protein